MSGNTKKSSSLKNWFTFICVVAILVFVNLLIFNGNLFANDSERAVKVTNIGDTVVLQYSSKRETYRIDGIDNSEFKYFGGVHTFFNEEYSVREDGTPYGILNSEGTRVATVKLRRDNNEYITKEIDLAKANGEILYEIPAEYDRVIIFTTDEYDMQYSASIQIKDRSNPIEIIFDNVTIKAPDVSPVLYSMSDADVNVKIKGNVVLHGGNNPYTLEHVTGSEKFYDTVNTAASAYCVCMVSAIGTAASIVYGVEYYMDMFEGVSALQLTALENAWGKVESLVNGEDGQPGLDGVPAIMVAAGLNVSGEDGASLSVKGGRGGDGGSGSGAFMTKPRGGNGGDGGSGIVCGNFVNYLGAKLSIESGDPGQGGEGGTSLTGTGYPGNRGSKLDPKVVLDWELTVS